MFHAVDHRPWRQSVTIRMASRHRLNPMQRLDRGHVTARLTAILLAVTCPLFANAQGGDGAPRPVAGDTDTSAPEPLPTYLFDEVIVTGAPLPRTIAELAKPVTVVEGTRLQARVAPQLGEVLAEEAGVNQTYFGPGASRPVIRGLGGDNIRVLENGLGLLDASSISPDHAVGVEPLLVRRIEVVRGPSALLYGPNAIGGVVNVTTSRLPEEPIDVAIRGALQGRGNSVNDEGAGVGYLEGGYAGFALHANGFARKANDTAIPGFARSSRLREAEPLPPDEAEPRNTLVNTALETTGAGVGATYFWDGGSLGLSPALYRSTYGIAGAPSTYIDLEQRRLDIAGSFDAPLPRLSSVKTRLGLVDYKHEEIEATTRGNFVATEFRNRGYDLRIDAVHDPIGRVEGAIGFESFYSDFDASGAEAFFPPTTTATQSLFAFEEILFGPARVQASGRLDFSNLDASASPVFGPADSRSFVTGGASAGAVITPIDPYSLAVNVAYTQRSPNAAELFANGPHLATGQFEIGDRDLSLQESLGFEVVARRAAGPVTGSIGGYYNRFNNFIDLIPTGEFFDTSEIGHSHGGVELIPVFQFENVPAVFVGMEAEATVRVVDEKPYTVDLNFLADWVYARNRTTREPLPYLPPLRLGTGFAAAWGDLAGELSLLWARRQEETPEFILPTDDYLMLNIGANYQIELKLVTVDFFLRGTNLLNQEARVSTSPLKDIAPLPGAGATGGVLLRF